MGRFSTKKAVGGGTWCRSYLSRSVLCDQFVTPVSWHVTRNYSTEFTSVRYPDIKRGNYAKVSEEDVNFFRDLLPGDGRVLTAEDDVEGYNIDWLGIVRGMYTMGQQYSPNM